MKNPFNFFIAILETLHIQFLDYESDFFQLAQLEFYATNTGFVRFFIN